MPLRTKMKNKNSSAFLLVALNMRDRDRIFVQSVKIVSSKSAGTSATTADADLPSGTGESKQNKDSSVDPTAPGTAFLFFPTSSLWPHEFLSSWFSSGEHAVQARDQNLLHEGPGSSASSSSSSTFLETKQKQIKYGNLRGSRNRALGRGVTATGTELVVAGTSYFARRSRSRRRTRTS
ncbi:unnamed protein product [Amoebophrya sp. A120]|nr:unnamed protein product [Amoebophrya sp. A120]|eukprot:GSA120T00013733001.1